MECSRLSAYIREQAPDVDMVPGSIVKVACKYSPKRFWIILAMPKAMTLRVSFEKYGLNVATICPIFPSLLVDMIRRLCQRAKHCKTLLQRSCVRHGDFFLADYYCRGKHCTDSDRPRGADGLRLWCKRSVIEAMKEGVEDGDVDGSLEDMLDATMKNLVNSPRATLCGYEGPADDIEEMLRRRWKRSNQWPLLEALGRYA
eukprot:gene24033-29082_t